MLFGRHGQAILVNYDRKSRLIMAAAQDKSSQSTYLNLRDMVAPLPKSHRQSITFDNGTEFAKHHILEKQTEIKSYFCDIRSPWQKGGVENSIGRLRRALPRSTDLKSISQEMLDMIVAQHNNTPRKCLEYQTPAEVFLRNLQPLHFKRESTFLRRHTTVRGNIFRDGKRLELPLF